MKTYEQDYINEDNKHSDHVYIIGSNTQNIDTQMIKLLNENFYVETDDHFEMNERFRWYAPGSHVVWDTLSNDRIYLNCASSSLVTLAVGGLKESYINKILETKTATVKFLNLLGDNFTEHQQILSDFSKMSQVIKPGDVKDILDARIKDSFKERLINHILQRTIKGIDKDDNITLDVIIENILPYLKDESRSLRSILKRKNLLDDDYNICLSSSLRNEIDKRRNRREIGEAVLVGAGVATLGMVGVSIAQANNCSIM